MRESRQISFVLHTRAYRETSLLVDFFSRNHGRVSVVANGVRKAKSRFEISPFVQSEIAWSGKAQLKTLTGCESIKYYQLLGSALFSAMYLNEILMRVLQPFDPHPALYDGYQAVLDQLVDNAGSELEINLREFEKLLLKEIGYEVLFDQDVRKECMVEPDLHYSYFPGQGFSRLDLQSDLNHEDVSPVYAGKILLHIAKSDYSDRQTRQVAKQIMRSALRPHVGDRPLLSRSLFAGKRVSGVDKQSLNAEGS